MAYSVGGESSSSSDTSISTSKWEYDVFLSFAGNDTRLNFTGHLYEAFIRSGIRCFRDDVDLLKGEDLNYLFQAIQDSLCAVLVISENYANSTWCLDELQKILKSQNTLHRRVFPIFYNVDPADVRHQRQRFREALAKHEEKSKENTTKVQNWRNALFEIANLCGWDTRGKHEADLIKNIVGEVWTYLSSKLPSYHHKLVGIDSRVADMMRILEIGLNDARFVGIWGMGGVGKTTLARVVSEKLSNKFEVCCFLFKVSETLLQREGLVSLQKRLLSHLKIKNMEISDDHEGMKTIRKFLGNKKVLLVLDDVDDMRQLENLASPDWFGEGSRIIITTRDSQLLTSSGVDKQRIYEMKTMKKDESLQLFSNKAFHKDNPEENYLELSESLVKYAGGLPLALDVLGSFLCKRSEAEWRDALDRLKQIPHNNIIQVLKISYDVLNEEEKTIFLDIACFFKGCWKKTVTQILKSCDLHPTIGINVLIEKSLLIETEDCRLEMHDLLEDLGRYIVQQESPNVGNRSRLWKAEDIKEVLQNNKGSEAIQAIVWQGYYGNLDKIEVHPEAFLKMSNIRFICMAETFRLWPLILPGTLKLWNGMQFTRKLKFIDLSGSEGFTETPDFSRVPYLEHLRLFNCKSLVKVHDSLGELKKLVVVDLSCCENLQILPRKLETNSLSMLVLYSCSKLPVLPEFGEGMKKLSSLAASKTAITKLPESLASLTGLIYLDLSGGNPTKTKLPPESLGSLTGVIYLDLSGGKILNADVLLKTHITRPISDVKATLLTELYLRGCGLDDGFVPNDLASLSSLIVLDLSYNNFVNLPTGCFSSLFGLIFLSLNHCKRLMSLPRLPPRLIRLNAVGCKLMGPLSERQLWNWVASLDHEYRRRTKYVISYEENDDHMPPFKFDHVDPVECVVPLRDFCAVISGYNMPSFIPSRFLGCKLPSWFLNKKYENDICRPFDTRIECEIKVDIPPHFHESEWLGIVVCFHIKSNCVEDRITWSSKAAEDEDYIWKEWGHAHVRSEDDKDDNLWIMVLELNEETCWKHLRANNNSLHIKLSTCKEVFSRVSSISGCGWRVIRKEEIQKWCHLNHFNQLTPPQLASPRELKLRWRALENFIEKVDKEWLIQDLKKNREEDKNRFADYMHMRSTIFTKR